MNKSGDRFLIYQLTAESERNLHFAPLAYLREKELEVNRNNYKCVYYDDFNDGETLDSIYERFNLRHPADFRGHSLSVSDIIVLHQNGQQHAFYVDSFGFQQVPEFFAHNPLEKVEELLEDDYGMIDGIINNGDRQKEQQKDKKESVLDRLKEQQRAVPQADKGIVEDAKEKADLGQIRAFGVDIGER